MGVVTGKSAKIAIYSGSTYKDQSVWGISDFSLTFDRSSVEQELVGQTGNWFDYGKLSVEKDNVIWVCHAITANSDAEDWWNGIVGENKIYNPDEYLSHLYSWFSKGLNLKAEDLVFHEDIWAGSGNFGPCIEIFSGLLDFDNIPQ